MEIQKKELEDKQCRLCYDVILHPQLGGDSGGGSGHRAPESPPYVNNDGGERDWNRDRRDRCEDHQRRGPRTPPIPNAGGGGNRNRGGGRNNEGDDGHLNDGGHGYHDDDHGHRDGHHNQNQDDTRGPGDYYDGDEDALNR